MARRGCADGSCAVVEIEPVVPKTTEQINKERAVGRSVLSKLGIPKDLHSIQAINLHGNRWRVNVRRILDTSKLLPTVSITDSFYVLADKNGNVLDEIASKY